ncbi:MAG: NosD domain-containing protein, partial [Candidatus Nanoarchaeia archaeon]
MMMKKRRKAELSIAIVLVAFILLSVATILVKFPGITGRMFSVPEEKPSMGAQGEFTIMSTLTSTYNLTDTTNNKAYKNKFSGTKPPKAPGDAGYTEYSGSEYTNAANLDTSRNSWTFTGDDGYVNLLYVIKINESVGDITNITLKWVGFDRLVEGSQFALYIRNHTANAWLNWATDSTPRSSDQTYTYTYASGFSDLINGSGYMHIGVSGAYHTAVCPFVYSYNGTDYSFEGYILHDFGTKEKEGTSYTVLSKITEPRIKIANQLNEVEYIDALSLRVTDSLGDDTKVFTLNPISITNSNLSLIDNRDESYLILYEGDEYYIEFEEFPSKPEGYEREIEVIASGFYEPLNSVAIQEGRFVPYVGAEIQENYFEVKVVYEAQVPPTANNFPTEYGSTNFSEVPDITNVSNMTLATQHGKIIWLNSVNAEGEDYDSNVRIGAGFVSINTAALHETINSTANVTINNINCSKFALYFAPGFYETAAGLLSDAEKSLMATEANIGSNCIDPTICTNVACTDGNLTFVAQHFTGFAEGVDANLTIWDETDSGMPYGDQTRYPNEQVRFFANYTYANGTLINDANCTISFADSLDNDMILNGSISLFEYTRSFSSAGNYEWNATCNKTGFTTLNASDNVTIASCSCVNCSDCTAKLNSGCAAVNLTQDITASGTCINWPAVSNKTLDCQNNIITGNTSGYGIYIAGSGRINNTIMNCYIQNFSYGFYIGASFNRLVNITVSKNTEGIYLKGATQNNFTNIQVYNSSAHGIYLSTTSDSNRFNNTVIDTAAAALSFDQSDLNNLTNTTIINATSTWIYGSAGAPPSNYLYDTTLMYNQTIGKINWLSRIDVVDHTLDNSNFRLRPDFVSLYATSETSAFNKTANITIQVDSCNNLQFYRKSGFPLTKEDIIVNGTTFTPAYQSCSDGIAMFSTDYNWSGYSAQSVNCTCVNCSDCTAKLNLNCTVVNLTVDIIDHSGTCINNPANFTNKTFDCQGYTIDGDNSGTDYGITINSKTGNTIKNCIIAGFYHGIYLLSSSNNSLANNAVYNNTVHGILISSSHYNNITDSNVSFNPNDGIYITSSSYNR